MPTTPQFSDAGKDSPVNTVLNQNLLNRPHLSALQIAILRHLETVGPAGPVDAYGQQYVGHWPTTGKIIVAIGRRKCNADFAAVSRALARLCRAGLVETATCLFLPGRGFRYALTEAGRQALAAIEAAEIAAGQEVLA